RTLRTDGDVWSRSCAGTRGATSPRTSRYRADMNRENQMTSTFVEQRTQSLEPEPERRGPTVVALCRTATGDVFGLEGKKRRWVVGTNSSCEIQLEDPFVS